MIPLFFQYSLLFKKAITIFENDVNEKNQILRDLEEQYNALKLNQKTEKKAQVFFYWLIASYTFQEEDLSNFKNKILESDQEIRYITEKCKDLNISNKQMEDEIK